MLPNQNTILRLNNQQLKLMTIIPVPHNVRAESVHTTGVARQIYPPVR